MTTPSDQKLFVTVANGHLGRQVIDALLVLRQTTSSRASVPAITN